MSDNEEESEYNEELSDVEEEEPENVEEDDNFYNNNKSQPLSEDEDEEYDEQKTELDNNIINNIEKDDYDDEDDEDESSDSDLEENDLNIYTHIDDEYKTNFIREIHPEEINDTFENIKNLTNIVRKEIVFDSNNHKGVYMIKDDKHKTFPFLTKYERARVIGIRISQLNNGAIPFINSKHKIIDNHIIAEQELIEKKLPFVICRPLPNGEKEYWRLDDLEIIER